MHGERARRSRVIAGGVGVGVVVALVVLWPRAAEVPTGADAAKEGEPAAAERAPALLRASAAAGNFAAPRTSEPAPLGPSQYAIAGVVRDVASGTALPGIRVQLEGRDTPTPDVAVTDGSGRFRFVREVGDERFSWLWAWDPRWVLIRRHVEGRPDDTSARREAGAVTEFVLWMTRVFHLRGTVVGERGQHLAQARYRYGFPHLVDGGNATSIAMVSHETDENGRFDAGPFTEGAGAEDWSTLTVSDERHATLRIDPRSVPFHDRDSLTIALSRGVTLAGVLVDPAGKPLADAVVAAEYGPADRAFRRGTRTNTRGQWKLKPLPARELVLVAHAFDDDAKARRVIAKPVDDSDVRLVADTIRLSKDPKTTKVLGVALVDVDDEIRAAYDVPAEVRVMFYDSGTFPDRLVFGRVERGYGLLKVGANPVASVREVVERLLADPSAEERLESPRGSRRVSTTHWDENGGGTGGAYVDLDEARAASLRATLESLKR